jgi:hypothetical protein
VLIDEIQYFGPVELGALIMAMHKVQQRQLPMVLLGAGLPILSGLAGESKSYAERRFSFPDIGALSQADKIPERRHSTSVLMQDALFSIDANRKKRRSATPELAA